MQKMAAVATRGSAAQRQTTTSQETRKKRRPKRARRSLNKFKRLFILVVPALIFALALGWMSVYARISVNDCSNPKIKEVCRGERMKNQRLKLRLDSLSSPHNLVAAAQKSGMVYAARYDFIGKPQAVASAGERTGE
ncbi:MAG: hypothetical protein NT018_05470 [Armatimonadetes bacterium]|nr:hypothetical protein [Armatimonadota bacterium]